MKITKDMTIAEILRAYPQTADIFRSFGMHCLSCPGATGESLEQASLVHGFKVDEILEALNKAVE